MKEFDKNIASELQKNHFAINNSVNTNLSNSTVTVVELPTHFMKREIIEPTNQTSLFDELDYGNYE